MQDNGLNLYGVDLFGNPIKPKKSGPLAERFEFPPFSVLNAREGEWQERKRAWIGMGIKSELGRGGGLTMSAEEVTTQNLNYYRNKEKAKLSPGGSTDGAGRPIEQTESSKKYNVNAHLDPAAQKALGCYYGANAIERAAGSQTGTSIFDPVLCELMYHWFAPPRGQIVDPFAGGSVRGILAGLMGYKYHGIDLSAPQVEANRIQLAEIAPEAEVEWVAGDSIEKLSEAPDADFIMTCPPYGDLEVYSDDPRDLSTMEYHTFIAAYKRIILRCYQKLKNNRLACFVVGDFRDRRTGNYRGFVADTVNAFREVGMELYNDAILVTAVGSLPIRVSNQFEKSRKLGKTHQNILVFAKGNPVKAFAGKSV